MQADTVEVVGWVDDPDTYPDSAEAHVVRVPPRGGAPAAAHEHARRGRARAALRSAWPIHRYFHEHGFFWVHTPIVTASDAEGAGEMFRVSTLDLANPARFRARPTAGPTSARTSSARKRFSPSAVS